MSKSKRQERSSRPRKASITRSGKPTRLTGTVSKEPGWPSTFARGAVYALGKAVIDYLITLLPFD